MAGITYNNLPRRIEWCNFFLALMNIYHTITSIIVKTILVTQCQLMNDNWPSKFWKQLLVLQHVLLSNV